MLMHTREGTTIVTLQEKLKTKPDNRWTIYFKGSALFDPFCCRESIISYLQRAVSAPDKPSWAKPTFTRYIVLKVWHFPWKINNKPLPGGFSWSVFPAIIHFQNSNSSDFYMAWNSRDFISRLAALRSKKLAPLAIELMTLNSTVASMGVSGALSSLSHFSSL